MTFTLFYYFDGDSVQLLPTGAVGEANHEVIVAGSSIGRNLDVVMGVVLAQTGRDGKALVIDPGCAFAVFVFMFVLVMVVTLAHLVVVVVIVGLGAMRVVVEVVVNFDIVVAQFLIVGHDVVEGDDVARMVLLTVDGVGGDALVADDGRCHVLVVIVATASIETNCQ